MTWYLAALIAGLGFALQNPINAGLGRHIGGAVPASLVSFTVGALAIAVVNVALLLSGNPLSFRALASVPAYLLMGGLCGAVGVTVMTMVVPRLGVAPAVTTMLCGQLLCALAVDRFGWFSGQSIEIAPRRYAGALLLMAAVWLLRR
jgi:transporter family-2 protein